MTTGLRSFGDLVMAHKGQRICVMAGGPNLAADIERVDADVWISVNEHGAKLREVDYVVAMDNTHTKLHVPMNKHLRKFTKAPIIGPWHWNDYQLMRWPLQPRFMISGVVASWVASMMGAHPVILAGFDCYNGDAPTVRQHENYREHLIGQVRVCSGPLLKFHQVHSQAEVLEAYVPPKALDLDALTEGEIVVEVMKPFEFRGREWPIGTRLRVSRFEVRLQLKHKSLKEVSNGA